MIQDYRVYDLNRRERAVCFLEGMALNALISQLFYDSWLFLIPGMLLVFFYFREKKRVLARRRMRRMRQELREFLNAMIAALQTGRSIENAFVQAVRDSREYFGKDTELLLEMKRICAAVGVNEPLDKLLSEFADRSSMEELKYFAEVFAVGKRSGGNLVSIIKNTTRMLRERMEAEDEIAALTARRRLEFYIMSVIPMAMIVYLRIGAAGLITRLYGNGFGAAVMTVCLVIYGGCYLYGQKLLEAEN